MKDKLEEIYNKIYVDKTENTKSIITLIEPEIDAFMKIETSDSDCFFIATYLISEFGVSFYNQGYLKKAKPYIEKGIQNIELDYNQKDKDVFKDELYIELIWVRGVINNNLKKYRIASRDFKSLVDHFPDNDRYKNWYKGSKNYTINLIEWVLIRIMFVCVLIGLDHKMFLFISAAAAIGLIISLIYRFITRVK